MQVSKQLADVVEDPERITNRLDVKFAADTIESLVEVQSKLKEVCMTEN